MNELKNCPYCGGDSLVVTDFDTPDNPQAIECQKCEATTGDYYCGEINAINAWNTRPREEALQATIKEQAELIKKFISNYHPNSDWATDEDIKLAKYLLAKGATKELTNAKQEA